jgi:hypothetical protein
MDLYGKPYKTNNINSNRITIDGRLSTNKKKEYKKNVSFNNCVTFLD